MSSNNTAVFQFNFKVGNGLFNIYAENGAEATELLEFFEGELLGKINDIEQKINVANQLNRPTAAAPATPSASTAPAAAPASAPAPVQAGGDAPMCEHGQPAKLIPGGISKASGKPYRAFYACAQPREAQCGFRQSA